MTATGDFHNIGCPYLRRPPKGRRCCASHIRNAMCCCRDVQRAPGCPEGLQEIPKSGNVKGVQEPKKICATRASLSASNDQVSADNAASSSLRHSCRSRSVSCSLRSSPPAGQPWTRSRADASGDGRIDGLRVGAAAFRQALLVGAAAEERRQQSEQPPMRGVRVAAPRSRGCGRSRRRLGDLGLDCLGRARRLRAPALPDVLHELDAVILQDPLRTADRVALAVEQMADAAQQIDVVGPVVAPAAAALHRLDLLEARFPEAQHVLRQVEIVRDFADGPECVGRLFRHGLPSRRRTLYW